MIGRGLQRITREYYECNRSDDETDYIVVMVHQDIPICLIMIVVWSNWVMLA